MLDKSKNIMEDKPPFLGSWNKIYLFVFGELVILILLFYLFTKVFS
jgi:hypothetical protein